MERVHPDGFERDCRARFGYQGTAVVRFTMAKSGSGQWQGSVEVRREGGMQLMYCNLKYWSDIMLQSVTGH